MRARLFLVVDKDDDIDSKFLFVIFNSVDVLLNELYERVRLLFKVNKEDEMDSKFLLVLFKSADDEFNVLIVNSCFGSILDSSIIEDSA